MSGFDLIPSLDNLEFADNPDQRTPCLLLLDNSYSMSNGPIQELNRGLALMAQQLIEDNLTRRRVEISVVTFGNDVVRVNDFQTISEWQAPTLRTSGATPMGAAIEFGLDHLESRKREYDDAGVPSTKPFIFLITDGAPTDDWRRAAQRVHDGDEAGEFAFFAVGVQGADMRTLERISLRKPAKLKGLNFVELFEWISRSLESMSRSVSGTVVRLESRDDWSEI